MVNVKPVKLGKNTRMSFQKINEVLEMPNLIEVQKNSYQWFLDEGLKEVSKDIDAIVDHNDNLVLSFTGYQLDDEPKYSIAEWKKSDAAYIGVVPGLNTSIIAITATAAAQVLIHPLKLIFRIFGAF